MPRVSRRNIAHTCLAAGLAAALALPAAGCGEPVEPLGEGSLALNWQVSPAGCAEAGVDNVEVRLDNAHRSYADSYACTDGEAIVEGISSGNYELTVVGLDESERETFSSKSRVVTIGAEKLNETSMVRLTAKPADVEVAWRFANGRVCGANGVSRVEVALYDQAFYELARQRFDCDSGSGVIEDLIAGDYIVEAVAAGDEATYRGVSETKLKRGDHGLVDVELERE